MEIDFSRVVDTLPGLVWTAFPDGRADFVNKPWCEYTGFSLEEAGAEGWQAAVHPDDRPQLIENWLAIAQSGAPGELEARLRRFDGEYRRFLFRFSPLTDASGQVVRWCGINTDIGDRKWAEALLAGEKRLLQMVAQGSALGDVLETLCRLVEDIACGSLCSILTIDPDSIRFRHGAGPSLPAAYNEVLDGLVMDRHFGPCGMAANLKTQVIAADVASDPRWRASPWPGLVVAHGLRSCWSTPILSRNDEVIGVFALYQRQPADPSAREMDLVAQFAHLAGIAIERAESDAALRRSEGRKAAILDSALDCIITIDHQGRILEFNRAAERTFGYRLDQVVGEPLAEVIIPPSQREPHRQGLARYLATGESGVIGRHIELTAMRADGSEFPVELTISRIPTDGPPAFTGFLRDITARKEAENELRRSEAFLAEAQQLSSTGSFVWDALADEEIWSDALYRIFEVDPGTKINLPLVRQVVHPEDLPRVAAATQQALAGEAPDYFFRIITPGGAIKHMHCVAHRSEQIADRPIFIGAIQDVTERHRGEEALNRARAELTHVARITALSALTASIAHEVNQPLAGIITNANTCLRMLAGDPPNVAGAQETARRTVRDGNRAADIIKRLRALFSKTETTSEAVDLNEAAREVIALSWSDLQRNQVVVRSEFDPELPQVAGDRVQLQQVILNLLLNASDAMRGVDDRTRQVTIRTEQEDAGHVRLTVQDTGAGIETQISERLFEAFVTTKSEGMGIGLSVSRTIIDNHGGRIWAQPNEGPGASFAFSIPCISQDGAAVHVASHDAGAAPEDPRPVAVER